MDRRRALATVGSGLSLPLAGCVVGGEPVVGTTALSGPTRCSDGAKTHSGFSREGATVARISLLKRRFDPGPGDGAGRFRLSVSHGAELRTERLRYRLRAPAGDLRAAGGDALVAHHVPAGRRAATDARRSHGPRTAGGRKVTLDFLTDTAAEADGFGLAVDAMATFSGPGVRQFRATGSLDRRLERNA
jgi:hypothetical protein